MIFNNNNKIHFSCPQGNLAYSDICKINENEFRLEHGLRCLSIKKQDINYRNSVSNYKNNVNYPGQQIRNMSFGLHHDNSEAGPDESVYIYDENKELIIRIELREELNNGASSESLNIYVRYV